MHLERSVNGPNSAPYSSKSRRSIWPFLHSEMCIIHLTVLVDWVQTDFIFSHGSCGTFRGAPNLSICHPSQSQASFPPQGAGSSASDLSVLLPGADCIGIHLPGWLDTASCSTVHGKQEEGLPRLLCVPGCSHSWPSSLSTQQTNLRAEGLRQVGWDLHSPSLTPPLHLQTLLRPRPWSKL